MSSRLRSVLVGASALAITGTMLVAGATSASAAVTPGWTPDANSAGGLYFYDATGHEITSGSLSASPMAAYYVGSGGLIGGLGPKAFVATSTPVAGANSATWAGTQQYTSAQTQPLAGLPGDLAGSTKAIVAGASTDGNFTAQQITGFPNTSVVVGYANLYEVRMYTGTSSTWYSATVQVDTTAGTWTQVYPVQTVTTLADAAAPTTVVNPGSTTLTATVTPAAAGNVVWSEGAVVVGTSAANAAGVATLPIAYTTVGTHTYTARFVPTPGTAGLGSVATAVVVNVVAPADATNTALTVTPASGAGFSAQTLTAVVTDTTTPATTPVGAVAFYDNGSAIALAGTVTQAPAGTFVLHTSALGTGGHSIVAKFTGSAGLFNNSNSAAVSFLLTAPLCADGTTNCIDTQNITATVSAGTLTLTTPYTATNPFNVGNLVVNARGDAITGSATFPALADAALTITDTRAGNLGWVATVYDSPMTSPAVIGLNQYNVINGENIGLTGWGSSVPVGNAFQATQVVTNNLPDSYSAGGGALAPTTHGAGAGAGIWGGGGTLASTFATNPHGDGTVYLRANLTINAPTSTVAGVYSGTITFTVV